MTPDRFFSLVLILQTHRRITTGDLAEQVGVSVRTALRDVQWLQEAGLPILVERGRYGGVSLLPGGALDTSRLTPQERDHLALQGLDEPQRRQLGADREHRRARDKLTAGHQHTDLLPICAVVTTDNRPWFGWDAQGVEPSAIVGDLRRGVRIRINYRRSADTEPVWQLVDPYGLLAKAGRWYLVADHHGAARLYSLERLVQWRSMRSRRRIRPMTLAQVVTELTAHWGTVGAIQVDALLDAAQLDRAKRILGSRLTVPGSSPGGDGRISITITCREIEDVRQLLPFAGSLTVVDPPDARERLRDLAQ